MPLTDAILGPKYEPNIFTYSDDIIIWATFKEHLRLLNEVRDKLKISDLKFNLGKCEFFKLSLKYFRYFFRRPRYTYGPGEVHRIILTLLALQKLRDVMVSVLSTGSLLKICCPFLPHKSPDKGKK